MIDELSMLERKVAEVATLCRALRNENTQLRQKMEIASREYLDVVERMEEARRRIEQLAQRLPESKIVETK